jgi:rare lipoprotein A
MNKQIAISLLAILILTACGTTPQRKVEMPGKPAAQTTDGAYLAGDGPGTDAPANLDAIPDATIRNEPLHRYANRPYVALDKSYTPLTTVGEFKQRGTASWYGKKFHGQRTSSGEIYDMYAMTAAHPTLPIPSFARVTNLANQKSVVVRVNDRGPFLHERVIDLSYTAAYKLGIVNNGSAEVEVESLTPDAVITPIVIAEPVQSQPLETSAPPVAEAVPVIAPIVAETSPQASDGSVYLQLGAFKSQEGAEAYLAKMRSELSDTGKQFKLTNKDGLVRVHVGPYASQDEARSSAESLAGKLGFKPMVVLP